MENCPSAPDFPGSHGLLPMTLQHCCGPGLLAELPSLPSAYAAHSVSLVAAVGVVCLAVFANLAFSSRLLMAGEIIQNIQRDVAVCNE